MTDIKAMIAGLQEVLDDDDLFQRLAVPRGYLEHLLALAELVPELVVQLDEVRIEFENEMTEQGFGPDKRGTCTLNFAAPDNALLSGIRAALTRVKEVMGVAA